LAKRMRQDSAAGWLDMEKMQLTKRSGEK
jgi:hypothetical protein